MSLMFNSNSPSMVLAIRADGAPVQLPRHRRKDRRADAGSDRRAELLTALAAGEVFDLEMDVQAFFQADGIKNRNFVRFKNGMLAKFAKSFEGAPFLRDHQQGDSLAVGGRILSSTLERGEENGERTILQTLQVSAPWAIELALRGLMDKFSIGWNPTGAILCSGCNADFNDCLHQPGEDLDPDNDTGQAHTIEAIFTQAEGIETSVVPIPAVPQTGIDEVRAALTLARQPLHRSTTAEEPHMDLKAIMKALGLSDDAKPAELLGAIGELQGLRVRLQVEEAAHQQSKDALALLTETVTTMKAQVIAVQLGGLVEGAYKSGRLKPEHDAVGTRVQSKLELAVRDMAERFGIDVARDYLAGLPVLTPAGTPSVALATVRPQDPVPATAAIQFTPELESVMTQMGLSKEEVIAANPGIKLAAGGK